MRFSYLLSALCASSVLAAPAEEADSYVDGYSRKPRECGRRVPAPEFARTTTFERDVKILDNRGAPRYRYVQITPTARGKPYILFLHGFPSTLYDWRKQIDYFKSKGYGVIAPDLLGYGGTEKPGDFNAYASKKMAAEVISILDCEGIRTVSGVGHDFGSFFLSRLAFYYPDRFATYSFISNGYSPPGTNLTVAGVQAINANTKAALGYAIFGYWFFFNQPDAPRVLNTHPESATSLIYTNGPDIWKTQLCPEGAFRAWLEADKQEPRAPWTSEAEIQTHNRLFAGAYGPPLNWYKACLNGVNTEDEKAVPKDRYNLTKPVLLITGKRDPVAIPGLVEPGTRAYSPDIVVQQVDTGHWAALEAADQVNGYLETQFQKTPASK